MDKGIGYDHKIAEQTFKKLKDMGIGVPLGSADLHKIDVTVSAEEQERIKKIQKEHMEYLGESEYQPKSNSNKFSSAGKYSGIGQKQSAFARALEARGFDTSILSNITKGDWKIVFGREVWSLFKKEELKHRQAFGAGSINKVDQIMRRL